MNVYVQKLCVQWFDFDEKLLLLIIWVIIVVSLSGLTCWCPKVISGRMLDLIRPLGLTFWDPNHTFEWLWSHWSHFGPQETPLGPPDTLMSSHLVPKERSLGRPNLMTKSTSWEFGSRRNQNYWFLDVVKLWHRSRPTVSSWHLRKSTKKSIDFRNRSDSPLPGFPGDPV